MDSPTIGKCNNQRCQLQKKMMSTKFEINYKKNQNQNQKSNQKQATLLSLFHSFFHSFSDHMIERKSSIQMPM